MEGNHVVGWVFSTLLTLGVVRSQETAPGPRQLEQAARQLAKGGNHPEAARRWEDAARAWEPAGKQVEAARAWESASEEHERAADYESALTVAESALRLLRELHVDRDDAQLAKAIARTGYLSAQWLGRPKVGLPRLEEALAMRKRLFAGDHRDVATSLNNLAYCLQSLGRSADALPRYEETLAMRERLFAGDHPEVATSLNNVGYCLRSLGRLTEAMPRLEAGLAMRKRLFAGDHRDVATSLNNVAYCLESLGRTTDALPRHEEALAMSKRLFPGDHPSVATSLNNVAACLKSLGRITEALPRFEEALAMTNRLFPADHPHVARSVNNVASCLDSLGRRTEALPRFEEALAMSKRLFPGDHPVVVTYLTNVASCLESLGRSPEALPRLEEALEMSKRLFPGDHSHVATSLNVVGNCLKALGRSTEALPQYEAALAMRKRLFPGDHADIALSLNSLGSCLEWLGRSAEALPRYEEALAMRGRLFPGDHPSLATSLSNVAHCLLSLGRSTEALSRYEETLAMRQRMFPGDHPFVARSLHNVGKGLESLGRSTEALPWYEQALAMQNRLFPGGHPDTIWSLRTLARLHLGAKAPGLARPLLDEALRMLDSMRGASRDLEEADRSAYLRNLGAADLHDLMRRCQLLLGEPAEALRYCESGRARELLQRLENSRFDALAEAERRAVLRGDDAEARAIAALHGRLERADAGYGALVHQLTTTASDLKLPADERAQRMVEIEGRMAEADAARKAALRERARCVADVLKITEPAPPAQVAAMLQPGELLLALCLDDDGQSCAFLVERDKGHQVVPLPATRTLAGELVRRHLAALSRAQTTPERGVAPDAPGKEAVASAGKKLAEALLPGGLWERIATRTRVYIVPDDTLAMLPFDTLPVAKDTAGRERLWLDVGPPIAYSPSASVLCWLRERASRQRDDVTTHTVVALGDPVFLVPQEHAYPETGALITRVEPGSLAERVGLRVGDAILSFGGRKVTGDTGFRDAKHEVDVAIDTGERPAGPVQVRLWRQGEELEVQVERGQLGVSLGSGNAREAHALGYGDGKDNASRKLLLRDAELRKLGNLPRLPGTAAECKVIATAFAGTDDLERALASPRVRVLLAQRATEANLYEAAPRASYLHLATHGIADEVAQASFSALAVTMPARPGPDDNGFLDLHDLLHRWRDRLASCRMVVLSACRTSVGPQIKGEAVQALPIGFFYAGASSVIASVWSVDDASTAVLMADFYRRLAKREGAADRLQSFWDARKALRLDPRYADPFHWAAFLYFGSPR